MGKRSGKKAVTAAVVKATPPGAISKSRSKVPTRPASGAQRRKSTATARVRLSIQRDRAASAATREAFAAEASTTKPPPGYVANRPATGPVPDSSAVR